MTCLRKFFAAARYREIQSALGFGNHKFQHPLDFAGFVAKHNQVADVRSGLARVPPNVYSVLQNSSIRSRPFLMTSMLVA